MKIPSIPSVPAVPSVRQKLTSLYQDKVFSVLTGDYKGFKKASVEYAKLAVDNFDEVTKIPKMNVKVPLFSKINLKVAKVWFLDLFRKRTPEEKTFIKMCNDYKLRRDVFQQQEKNPFDS